MLSALAVHLTHYQLLPYRRRAELLGVFAGITLSPATLVDIGHAAAAHLSETVAAIVQSIVQNAVAHADETGMRVAAALQWQHLLCASLLTFYAVHAKRVAAVLTGIALRSGFPGIPIHDHWRAYPSTPAQHSRCHAHHLLELIALTEATPCGPAPSG